MAHSRCPVFQFASMKQVAHVPAAGQQRPMARSSSMVGFFLSTCQLHMLTLLYQRHLDELPTPGDVVLVELCKSVECGICLDVMFEPVVGECGHSFCAACIAAMLTGGARSCPICRGDFGQLDDRPNNILVRSLIQHYFPVEYERRRVRHARQIGAVEGGASGGLVLRPRAPPIVPRQERSGDDGRVWLRALLRMLRPLWPVFRYAPALIYPLFVAVLFWAMFRRNGRRRRPAA